MTTPTLPSFHQKIFAHAKSAQVSKDICLTKNKPYRLGSGSIGAWLPLRAHSAFTLVELLGVIAIIGILAGLTLGAAGAVRRAGASSQAKGEISALQAACERYYADKTAYPAFTNQSPENSFNPSSYTNGSKFLFTNLFGATSVSNNPTGKRYFEPKPNMVQNGQYFVDPWGYAYGYYSDGTNPPLIWSTAGGISKGETNKWLVSWPQN